MITPAQRSQLLQAAREVLEKAYAPIPICAWGRPC